MKQIPDANNVYGVVKSARGLQPVLDAVLGLQLWDVARIYKSQFDLSESLRLSNEVADFETQTLPEEGEHLFNGAVAGNLSEVIAFVTTLSDTLSDCRIDHQFEIYDEARELSAWVPERKDSQVV